MIKIDILFEDEFLAVINKPPGVVVNRAETVAEETVQSWWEERLAIEGQGRADRDAATKVDRADWEAFLPAEFDASFGEPDSIFQQRGGIVHRLDKDTSGVMVLAKNPGVLVNLLHQFKTRQTTKKYIALTHGKFGIPEATISEPIGRASRDRTMFAVRPDGREAVTRYQVIKGFTQLATDPWATTTEIKLPELTRRLRIYEGFSLVECWPKTGRTHQIRVHLAHVRHPIVGDLTYVGRKRQALDPLWCPRQFLHASQLTLTHPATNQPLIVTAPLAPDLERVLELLS